jgi:LacI family transcriptional regulator
MKHILLQRSDVTVFHRFARGFAQAWRDMGRPCELRLQDITLERVSDPECIGIAGGQLYQATLPREILKDKFIINISQRFQKDPRGWNLFVDNEEIGTLAAHHFLEKGFRRLAILEEHTHQFSRVRAEAFCRIAEREGLPVSRYVVKYSSRITREENTSRVLEGLMKFAAKLEPPTGIFAVTDLIANTFMQATGTLKSFHPELHGLLGVDDLFEDPFALEYCRLSLSSIRSPYERMGRIAADHVAKGLSTGTFPSGTEWISGSTLVERESTSGWATKDLEVARAMQRIHFWMEEGELPSVRRLTEFCGCSQRTLYNRFQAAVQKSPQDVILLTRLRKAADQLIHTSKPITDIALGLGFTPAGSLTTHFKKRFGMTPRAYRNLHGKPKS